MKAEIKERIEMISRGEVPEGYKKTKVGIIPEDWEVKRLKKYANIIDGDRGKNYPNDKDIVNSGVLFLSTKNIINSKFDFNEKRFITKEKFAELRKGKLQSHDVVITMRGSIGNVALFQGIEYESAFINAQMAIIRPYNINSEFLWLIMHSSSVQKRINVMSSGSAQPQLTKKVIEQLHIPKPSCLEQQKIAQILSTWDKAIELKEQLLEVKKEQKKGLMQGLLTGEVRLPGYDEEWEEVRLGDIGEFSTSSVNKKIENKQELVRLVNYMDVYNNYIIDDSIDYMIVSATESQIDKFSLQKGDVLFTPSSETADEIGHSAVVKTDQGKLLYSYHLVRLRFKKLMDLDFKGYVFNNTDILGKFTKLASGATRYTLNLDDFRETSIKIPKSLEEQKAIAQVLSTANKEIELLEEELEQLKLQKKGLMQLLLTGIIRVKS